MTTRSEALSRVVGMLTAARAGSRDHSQSEDDLAAVFSSLLADDGTDQGFQVGFSFSPGDPPEVIEAAVQAAFNDALQRVTSRATGQFGAFAGAFIVAFNALAAEYELWCPDADVPGLLRRLGIQTAGEDG